MLRRFGSHMRPEFENASLDVREEARPLDGFESTGW